MNRLLCDSLLIVDDNEAALRVTSSLFREEGYKVFSCAYPREAINTLKCIHVDAVLSDIRMPEITGIQLLHEIHGIDPEMPVILMTGYAELDMAIDAVKKDAFDFVTKPYEPEYLIGSIKRAVDFRKNQQIERNGKTCLKQTSSRKRRNCPTPYSK